MSDVWRSVAHKYCWWKKSCTTQHVWHPVNNGIFTISTGTGFLPSTVSRLEICWNPTWPDFFCCWVKMQSFHFDGSNLEEDRRCQKYLGGGNSNISYVHPYLGRISNLTNIFQMGWNHQPDIYDFGVQQVGSTKNQRLLEWKWKWKVGCFFGTWKMHGWTTIISFLAGRVSIFATIVGLCLEDHRRTWILG